MRAAELTRITAETEIRVRVNLDGTGRSAVDTGNGFFDHMLTLFAHHGLFDLEVCCKGDRSVDFHHSAEDTGIVLGNAFREALGDKAGIARYGSITLPMEEALVTVALDISGRALFVSDLALPAARTGDFDTENAPEFLMAFCRALGLNLHIEMLRGSNTHHILEAVFKGLGRALCQASAIDARRAGAVPSTKGVL